MGARSTTGLETVIDCFNLNGNRMTSQGSKRWHGKPIQSNRPFLELLLFSHSISHNRHTHVHAHTGWSCAYIMYLWAVCRVTADRGTCGNEKVFFCAVCRPILCTVCKFDCVWLCVQIWLCVHVCPWSITFGKMCIIQPEHTVMGTTVSHNATWTTKWKQQICTTDQQICIVHIQ